MSMPVRTDADGQDGEEGHEAEGDPECRADLAAVRHRRQGADDHATDDRTGQGREAAAGACVHRRRQEDAGEQPDETADDDPDDERSDPDVDRQRRRVADRRVELVQEAESEDDARERGDDDPGQRRPDVEVARHAEDQQHADEGDRREQQKTVDDPPAHRPEQPLAEEQGTADDEQERRRGGRRRRPRRRARAPRPISPAISAISALASSMWAWSRRTAASRVARIWARSPGGALRAARRRSAGGGGGDRRTAGRPGRRRRRRRGIRTAADRQQAGWRSRAACPTRGVPAAVFGRRSPGGRRSRRRVVQGAAPTADLGVGQLGVGRSG